MRRETYYIHRGEENQLYTVYKIESVFVLTILITLWMSDSKYRLDEERTDAVDNKYDDDNTDYYNGHEYVP